MNGTMEQGLVYGENVERKGMMETHISTMETTSSGAATAARSFNFSASFALKETVRTQDHNHGG